MVIRDESGKPIRGKEEEAPAAAPGAAGATPEQGAPPADEPKKGESKTPSKGSRVGTAKEGAARKKK